MVDINLGNRCNNHCIMCTTPLPLPESYLEPTWEQIFQKLERLDMNEESILFTGGEPTLRRDVFQILKYTRSRFKAAEIRLVTNARMLSIDRFVHRIARINDILVISEIHGPEKLHDEITQTSGSFRQARRGILNAISAGIRIELRIVVHRMNYRAVPEISQLIADEFKDVERIVIFPIDIIGNAHNNISALGVTLKEIVPYIETAAEFLINRNIKTSLYHMPLCMLRENYRCICERITVETRRIAFAEQCSRCTMRSNCPGIWASYARQFGTEEFKAVQ